MKINFGVFIKTLSILILFAGSKVSAYGSLDEFADGNLNNYRDPSDEDTLYLDSDVIVHPRWPNGTTLQYTFCNDAGYTAAPVTFFDTTNATTKLNEITADIGTAQTSWNVGTNTTLSFTSPAVVGVCPAFTQTSTHVIRFFQDLDTSLSAPGILAYTPTTYSMVAGKLVILDADILFNSKPGSNPKFSTGTCTSHGGCPPSNSFSFLGVLTHEMGHSLGLSHSPINDDNTTDGLNTLATMFPQVANLDDSEAMESLTLDDQRGKLYLYPGDPDGTGKISGKILRTASAGQRGAHVFAFDLTTKRTLVGSFSGKDGALVGNDGKFEIEGIPLDTDFALLVESLHRPDIGSAFNYARFNTPIQFALGDESEGYIDFATEAYPDVDVTDIRLTRDATVDPGFSQVKVFRLTSDQKEISDLTVYVSNSFYAPNDGESLNLTFSASPLTAAAPLKVKLSTSTALSLIDGATFTLKAKKGSGSEVDWTANVPKFNFTGASSEVEVSPTGLSISDGTYTLTATLTDSKYGTVTKTSSLVIKGWEKNSGSSNGGGGCLIRESESLSLYHLFALLVGLILIGLRQRLNQSISRKIC